jgi:hypothetical protein
MTDQLRFVASILSIFTHELNNHTSIMNESAGLVLDLIEIKGNSEDCGFEQISSVTGGITNQIKKTTTLVKYLNRFAHRMDIPISNYELNEVVEELIMLMNRVLNQKEIQIDLDLIKDGLIIYGNPSVLQYVIFSIIQGFLSCLKSGDKIIIKTLSVDSNAEIRFQFNSEQKLSLDIMNADKKWDYSEYIKQIGAGIVFGAQGATDLTLTIPLVKEG